MNYLTVQNISKTFGEKQLFNDLSFGLEKGQKVALIARNGAGKTTLLNIITGKVLQDEGTVVFRNDITVSILQQNIDIKEEGSILDYVFSAQSEEVKVLKQYEQLLLLIKKNDTPQNQEKLQELITKIDSLQAWDFENKVREVLNKFEIVNLDQAIAELSGGQKKRIALARVLIESPDLLILDEPTNHLDIDMIEWLEAFIAKQSLTLLLVTHDRSFLDNVCDEIVELDRGMIFHYKGKFDYFLEKKAEREENEQSEIEKAKNIYRTELEWVRRQPKARTTKSKARLDSFKDIESKAKTRLEINNQELSIEAKRMGKKILEIDNISKGFGDFVAVKDFSYLFKRGEKIGIVGKNGIGKSTFLNMLTGKLNPDNGSVTKGETIDIGYYTQDGLKAREDMRVIDIVKEIAEVVNLGKVTIGVSQFLYHFNFDHNTQYNYFGNLSGGEKRRLYLLITLLKNPNFLILDEPTNDLDILTLELLENFLQNFNGCLLVVSHDRHFLEKVTDRTFVFEGDGIIKDYHSTYTNYRIDKQKEIAELRKIEKEEKVKNKPKEVPKPKKNKPTYKQKKEYEELELAIEQLETEKDQLTERLNSGISDHEEIQKISTRIGEVMQQLDEKSERWMELAEIMEG
ncbi:MAG: ABC-F family ATP-binding cassette domain-containing protein [Hyphomicrobiales bacterium]